MGEGGIRIIDPYQVRRGFAYDSYAAMFAKYGVSTVPFDHFSRFSDTLDEGAPIIVVQTQGFLPKVPYDGNSSQLGPFERGWVRSGTDTGGQTYYVLDQAMAFAKNGHHVIILGQRFDDFPKYLRWYEHSSGGSVEIVRIPAGGVQPGPDGKPIRGHPFVRKEDLYPHLYGMSVDATAIGLLRGAYGFIGGYADGGVIAVAAGQALGRPSAFIAHSMGLRKLELMGRDPQDPASYFEPDLWFGPRLQAERAAFLGADIVVGNTPEEGLAYRNLYGIDVPHWEMLTPGANRLYFPDNREGASAEKTTALGLMRKHGLQTGRFFASWGRIAAAKNLAGQVRILGELRKLYPGEYDDVKLVIIGGNPEHPEGEERAEMEQVRRVAESYGLDVGYQGDVVRIGDLQPGVIAFLANEALAYLGTQFHEPYGMVPAEMLAIGGNGFVIVPEVAGFAKWLQKQGHADIAVITDLGHSSSSSRVDLQKYQRAAQAIHDFQHHPELRERIRRGSRLADRSFRWKAKADVMLDFLRAAANGYQSRPSLHLAMPTWYSAPRAVRGVGRTESPPQWLTEGSAQIPSPGSDAGLVPPDELLRVARQIGEKIADWLREADVQTRQLITVAGQQAALLADLIAAAIDRPSTRVQRVAGEVWQGGSPGQVKAAVKAEPLQQKDFVSFGGLVFVEEGAQAVVTDVTVGAINGDINIVSGEGGAIAPNTHVVITGGQWMANPALLPPFVRAPVTPIVP